MLLQTLWLTGWLSGCGSTDPVERVEQVTLLFQSRVDGEIEPCG